MPLTVKEANELKKLTKEINSEEKLKDAKDEWELVRVTAIDPKMLKERNKTLQGELIDIRKKSLDRKSVLINFNGKDVRFFPHRKENIKIDFGDVFVRGIDSARAVAEILRFADRSSEDLISKQLADQDSALNLELIRLINKFQQNIQVHQDMNDFKHAKEELQRFNGALVNLLVKNEVVADEEKASKAINFVRDFLWKKDICTSNCVIEKKENITILRYADPMKFGDTEFKKEDSPDNKAIDFWSGEQPWKTKLKRAVGGDETHQWFESFMKQNLDELKQLSSTPMSRYTPNPANAFDCSDILIQDDEVLSVDHHLRTAITEPLDVGDTKSRQDVTDWNHLQMISKSRLETEVNSFMEKWGTLYDEEETIPLTMLHQTLIGDEVALMPDQKKAQESKFGGSVIDSKVKANDAVRDLLAKIVIIRDKKTAKITFLSQKDRENIPPGHQRVNVDLLETNNCINMWAPLARVRNHDVNDARKLIQNAVTLYENAKSQVKNTDLQTIRDLETIIDFLNSSDHSLFTPYKFRGNEVKTAIAKLTKELKKVDGKFQHFPTQTTNNLALSLNAAVELKCTVHETWAGSLRRNIANFTRDYIRPIPLLGPVIDWSVRGTMTLVATVVKGVLAIFNAPQLYKHHMDREEIYKSAYEGLLAESLGALQGGCMSSADRAGEMAEQRVAMRQQFAKEGRIISYNDSPEVKKAFYTTYGRSQAKHDLVEMATGASVTSDTETRGFYAVNLISELSETVDEQKLSKSFSSLRKGKFDISMTVEAYLGQRAVGQPEEPQKHANPSSEIKKKHSQEDDSISEANNVMSP